MQSTSLEQNGRHHHFIWCNLFSQWYSWSIAHLVLNNNHSITHWYNLTFLCQLVGTYYIKGPIRLFMVYGV